MQAPRWQRVAEICDSALEVDPPRRRALVEEACGGDEDLLRQVTALLECGEAAGRFLETPALELVTSGCSGGGPERGASELPAGLEIGPYRIAARIGGGGMGEVYAARDTRLNRDVAVRCGPRTGDSLPFAGVVETSCGLLFSASAPRAGWSAC